jgi:hypothetical protein
MGEIKMAAESTLISARLATASRQQVAATLASGIIAASDRAHSIEQALEIMHDIYHAMYPEPSSTAYKEWAKTKDARLKKVHGE